MQQGSAGAAVTRVLKSSAQGQLATKSDVRPVTGKRRQGKHNGKAVRNMGSIKNVIKKPQKQKRCITAYMWQILEGASTVVVTSDVVTRARPDYPVSSQTSY